MQLAGGRFISIEPRKMQLYCEPCRLLAKSNYWLQRFSLTSIVLARRLCLLCLARWPAPDGYVAGPKERGQPRLTALFIRPYC
jgi:hypothetical protein